jgi:hypothetical protein
MRRDELIRGGEQVMHAVAESGVEEPLRAVSRLPSGASRLPEALLSRLLAALRVYGLHASRFTRPAREVASALELDSLDRAEAWSRIIGSERGPEEAARLLERLRFATGALPAVLALLRPVPRRISLPGGAEAEAAVLTVQVIEAHNRFSTPARLAMLLQSLETLYDACAQMEGANPGGLSVLSCDSGVDKTFELLGDVRGIERMRTVLLSLWDRVVFHRALPPVERYKVASATLPVLDELKRMAEAGALPREQAELLRRRIVEGTGRFLVAGATLPDLQEHAYANPRSLMAPAPKLIGPALRGEG